MQKQLRLMKLSKVLPIFFGIFIIILLAVHYSNGGFDSWFESDEPVKKVIADVKPTTEKLLVNDNVQQQGNNNPLDVIFDNVITLMVWAGIFIFIVQVIAIISKDQMKKSDDISDEREDDKEDDEDKKLRSECKDCLELYYPEDSNSIRPDKFCSLTCQKNDVLFDSDLYTCDLCEKEYDYNDSNATDTKKHCCLSCEKKAKDNEC